MAAARPDGPAPAIRISRSLGMIRRYGTARIRREFRSTLPHVIDEHRANDH
jgi:hypothetical protein